MINFFQSGINSVIADPADRLEIPETMSGLYSFLYPRTKNVTTESGKIVIQDEDELKTTRKYKANVAAESPTLDTSGAYPFLSFDNSNDRIFDMVYPEMASRTTIPDLSDSDAGKGFTGTGLTYDAALDCYWAANDGRTNGADVTFRACIVKLSINPTTGAVSLIQEIDISATITGSAQGITVDTSDNTLWVCAVSEHKIYHFSKTGTPLSGTITVVTNGANGLAYDPANDQFWICGNSILRRYNKSGTAVVTVSGMTEDFDHLYYDSTNQLLYITWGANGANPSRISVYDTQRSRYFRYFYYMNDILAIEGISISGNRMIVFSDEYMHSVGSVLTNQAVFFNIDNLGQYPQATMVMWAGVFTTPVTVSESGESVYWIGENGTEYGYAINPLTNVDIRFQVATTAAQRTSATVVPTDISNKSVLVFILDFAADNMRTYQNGTLINTSSSMLPATSFRMIPAIIGNQFVTDRDGNFKLYGYTIHLDNGGTTARQLIEGYWAWEQGLQNDLVAGHPWKTTDPRL